MKKIFGKVLLSGVLILWGITAAACGPGAENGGAMLPEAYSESEAAVDMVAGEEAGFDTAASVDAGGLESAPAETQITDSAMPSADLADQQAAPNDLALRKLIRNASLTVETEEYDALLTAVEERITRLGGYLEHFNTNKNSVYYGGEAYRNASMTVRMPVDRYDQFINEVSELANVLMRDESVQDVTLQYVDLESRKKSLVTEQERLLELLEAAETVEDVIAIEGRLSEVRYQLENMESQLRTYDNLIQYSTISLYVNEVERLTPVQEQTVWQKISTGFINSCRSLAVGGKNLFIWLIIVSPYLAVMAVMVVILLLMIRMYMKVEKRKKNTNGIRTKEKSKEETGKGSKQESESDAK